MAKKVSKKSSKEAELEAKENAAKKAAAKEAKTKSSASRYAAGTKTVEVKSLCNMQLRDGGVLAVGKKCEISEKEKKRLEDDSRGPFFEKP